MKSVRVIVSLLRLTVGVGLGTNKVAYQIQVSATVSAKKYFDDSGTDR